MLIEKNEYTVYEMKKERIFYKIRSFLLQYSCYKLKGEYIRNRGWVSI